MVDSWNSRQGPVLPQGPFSPDALYAALLAGPFIIAGPCVLESYDLAVETAFTVRDAAREAGLFVVFKSSYDKANRTSASSFRGFSTVKSPN